MKTSLQTQAKVGNEFPARIAKCAASYGEQKKEDGEISKLSRNGNYLIRQVSIKTDNHEDRERGSYS